MAPVAWMTRRIDDQRGYLFPWSAVFFAAGVGSFFALPADPGALHWAVVGLGAVFLVRLLAGPLRGSVTAAALLALALGGIAAGVRTAAVEAPVLGFRYYGPVEGRIVAIDRSASGKLRLTLDRVVLSRVPPARTPRRVRISLHGPQGYLDPVPGLVVGMTAHLGPPEGPVEPGGFDFRRHAYFKGLGAVGYTRVPALALAPPEGGLRVALWRGRMALSAAIRDTLPGATGAFAAAILTGDRSAIPSADLEALRASNLAHLLAISGLHMGLLTGVVFAAIRLAFAAVPLAALTLPTKKIAAVGALVAGAAYLALSGGNVATERAFIMVAVVFAAVLADRRALTLRAVALAAIIVLALRPEALTGPGFQMSFAATTALVAVWSVVRARWSALRPTWLRPVLAVLISSAVAGGATAPIAAAHFNQIPHYGLIANLLSVPLMGAVIMPAAVLAACLAPFGLGWIGLWIMDPPIRWILAVAHRVAETEGALSFVASPPPATLPLMALGALVIVLWRHWTRIAGTLGIAGALILWASADRPPALVSPSGGLVGLMTDEGRALSRARGDGFAADIWLENDGDPVTQDAAAARTGFRDDGIGQSFRIGGTEAVHLFGRGASDRVAAACATHGLVVLAGEAVAPPGCDLIDRVTLRESGAVALWDRDGVLVRVTARDRAGSRVWNGAPGRAQ